MYAALQTAASQLGYGVEKFCAEKARRAGIEPAHSGFGGRRPAIGTDDVCHAQGRTRTYAGHEGPSGLRPDAIAALPPTLQTERKCEDRGLREESAVSQSSVFGRNQRGRIRTFDLVRPRHACYQTAPHAEKTTCSRWESNPTLSD